MFSIHLFINRNRNTNPLNNSIQPKTSLRTSGHDLVLMTNILQSIIVSNTVDNSSLAFAKVFDNRISIPINKIVKNIIND